MMDVKALLQYVKATPLPPFSFGLGVVLVVSIAVALLARIKNASKRRLPPGPTGLPFVGNINDLPKPGEFEAHHWLKHKDKYGPISSVTVMGQTLVIVNDARLALELLEKRSAKYSSRPTQVFAGEMVGWENTLAFQQNDSRFRAIRKNMSRIIGSKKSASQFNQLQEIEVAHFLVHVLNQPEDLVNHIERETGTAILKIAYGYTAESHTRDPLITMAVDVMETFAVAGAPYNFLVDVLPILKHVPDWMPGAGFKQKAREWRATLDKSAELPYAFVKYQMARGVNEISFLSQLFEMGEPNSEVQWANKWSAMSLYVAGSDTTVSSIMTFVLAMTLHPDVQSKAQEEIDHVIGSTRLPSFSDRANLPFINAIVKEVIRWAPIAPMGVPHVVSEDDMVDGYHIPRGAIVFPNIWQCLHDSTRYNDPLKFDPSRFLETDTHTAEPDPKIYAFGFGRRICPGRILADETLYLNIVQCLAVFRIGKPIRNGIEVEPEVMFKPGIVSRPAPFGHTIKPRSDEHERLIRLVEKMHPWQNSDGDVLKNIEKGEIS